MKPRTARQRALAARRGKIVSSSTFVALFEKWQAGRKYPNRTHCKRGHKICAANACVNDLRRGSYACNPCFRADNRAWNKTPKRSAYMLAYNREYNNSPRMRAYFLAKKHERAASIRGNGGAWTAAEFAELCAKYNHRCVCCGKRQKMTADHVVPVVKGGPNIIGNLQPLCLSCNCSKGTRTIDYRINPHPACLKL